MLKLRPWYLITSSEDMIPEYWESEVSEWRDMWPSMVSHNVCSTFNPSKCTHTIVNIHTPSTHNWRSGQPMLRHPGSSWGFSTLLKGLASVVVLKVERERWLFTPPTDNSCQTWDSNLRPSVYKSDSLSIRPRFFSLQSWCKHIHIAMNRCFLKCCFFTSVILI